MLFFKQKMKSQREFLDKFGDFISRLDRTWPCAVETRNPNYLNGAYFDFLAEYGGGHPTRFRQIRAFMVRVNLFAPSDTMRVHAGEARRQMRDGFFQWLGPTPRIAVDTETGQEYRWEDVIVFEEGADPEDRRRLLSAIKNTPFLSGSIFLLFGGLLIMKMGKK